jgi:hypothetical protein
LFQSQFEQPKSGATIASEVAQEPYFKVKPLKQLVQAPDILSKALQKSLTAWHFPFETK